MNQSHCRIDHNLPSASLPNTALASPNEESANGLAGLSVILSVIFMGFLITVTAMPGYWEWAYWVSL